MHYIKPLFFAILCAMFSLPLGIYAQATRSVHTVKPGETLYAISKMYGVSVDEIKQANPGVQESINSGMQLFIPTGGNVCVFHTIQPKETLYSIAKKYRVETDSIVKANPGLSETNFKFGTTIKIPVSRMAVTAVDTTTVASVPSGIAGTNCREMYASAKGETLYDIAAKYNVEVVDLMAANPDIKKDAGKKLRKGTYVCIPFAKPKATAEDIHKSVANTSEKVILLKKSYKIVLLMPFYTDGGRSVDFYRGMLYGMNSLRKDGIDFSVEAYNAGQSVVDINKILSKESVKSADIVISSASEAVSNIVADFCKQHKIKMFLPFSVAFDAVFNNPYVALANMPQSYEYAAYVKFFFSSLPSTANVVLFEGSRQTDLYRKMVYELDARQSYKKIGTSASPAVFANALRNGVKNVVFPSSSLKEDYNALYTLISKSKSGVGEMDVRVFGYDNWKDFDTQTRETFFDIDVILCVPQFINVYSSGYSPSRQFYIDTFGSVPTTNMQRSYYLGIDCAAELFADGKASLSKPFKFARVSTWGGAMNKAMRIVNYTNKHTTVIRDYE